MAGGSPLTSLVVILVSLGVAVTLGLGIAGGFDTTTMVLLALILSFGLLAVAVTRRSRSGLVVPARCASCGGLISAHAPYCKHCGRPVTPAR